MESKRRGGKKMKSRRGEKKKRETEKNLVEEKLNFVRKIPRKFSVFQFFAETCHSCRPSWNPVDGYGINLQKIGNRGKNRKSGGIKDIKRAV